MSLLSPSLSVEAGVVERLERGETVTYVALGDSLAAGFELPFPARDAYPSVFGTILQRQFPQARVRVLRAGIPGDTIQGGLARLHRDVLVQQPDLVSVQFGGNDFGLGRPASEFQRDLQTLVRRIRQDCGAAVILATPPIVAPDSETPMVRAVKAVGLAENLPVADFDRAMRAHASGPRGPFPFGRHPNVYGHAAMARALYDAFRSFCPPKKPLRVNVVPGVRTLLASQHPEARVDIQTAGRANVALALECQGDKQTRTVTTGRDGRATATFPLPIPSHLDSFRQRLLVTAREGPDFDYDLRLATLRPVLKVGGDPVLLAAPGVVIGKEQWGGTGDLSGQVSARREQDSLQLRIEVRDDCVVRNWHLKEPFESDCVEVFLDHRPSERQGVPYWEQGVVGLFLPPKGPEDSPNVTWTSLEPVPDEWHQIKVERALLPHGYRIEAHIPLVLLGNPVPRFVGCDVALNDSDGPRGRRTQMVWAGGADNYLDPSLFGGLDLRPTPGEGPAKRLCIR